MTPDPRPRAIALPKGFLVGRYKVLRRLGYGHEGTVYLAESPSGRKRAIKLFRTYSDDDRYWVDCVARRLSLLRGCKAVVQLHEVGEFHRSSRLEYRYFVLEYVRGTPLLDVLRGSAAAHHITEQRALRIMLGVAALIAQLHSHGFAAGDFERGRNILVRHDGRLMFFDFDTGSPGARNRDYGFDLLPFVSIVRSLIRRASRSAVLTAALQIIDSWRAVQMGRGGFRALHRQLSEGAQADSK
jgi:serine/threonine protein kinase